MSRDVFVSDAPGPSSIYAWTVRRDGKTFVDFEKTEREWAGARVTRGVVRWKSSGNVPPSDILNCFEAVGFRFNRAATDQASQRDLDKLVRDHTAYRAAHGYSAEELFEMRAAFGEGAEVVDVLTGRKMRL